MPTPMAAIAPPTLFTIPIGAALAEAEETMPLPKKVLPILPLNISNIFEQGLHLQSNFFHNLFIELNLAHYG